MAVQYNTVTVGNTATQILGSSTGRKMFVIYNNGSNIVYLGPDSAVTTSNGIPITQQSSFTQNGDRMWQGAWYGITASATSDVRYMDYKE